MNASVATPVAYFSPYMYTDVMLTPRGRRGAKWTRMILQEAARRAARHDGPAYQTIQRFAEPVHREDEEYPIQSEIVQACGRQRREPYGGVTLLFSSYPVPLPVGEVEVRSAREDGLLVDPRREAAYLRFEARLLPALAGAPGGLTIGAIGEVTGVGRTNVGRYLDRFLAAHPDFSRDPATKRVRRAT